MSSNIDFVDICCGLNWGDEAKGKIISYLSKTKNYEFVCRWAGGNNAGHTIYLEGKKYKTHLIPSGIFYGKLSIIGHGCVVNEKDFFQEIQYNLLMAYLIFLKMIQINFSYLYIVENLLVQKLLY